LPEGTTPEPFTFYYRDGDVIRSLSSAPGAEPEVFLDPLAEFGLYLAPEEAYIWNWGSFSPDGRYAALILTNEPEPVDYSRMGHPVALYILDLRERSLHLVREGAYIPVWSPNGKLLAYLSDGLEVLDIETGKIFQVYVGAEEHYVEYYSWSPDTSRMAIRDELPFDSADIYVINIDQVEPPVHLNPGPRYWVGAPRWSPVDDRIAFTWASPGWPHRSDLWTKPPDGSDGTQLTRDIVVQDPLWSPDGKWIAFSGLALYEFENPPWNLWLIDPISADMKRLTYGPNLSAGENLIGWSPDGAQLIFNRSTPDNLQAVWVISLIDGSERMLLDSILVRDTGLTFGP
jgi:Tol biopolymer transport system component